MTVCIVGFEIDHKNSSDKNDSGFSQLKNAVSLLSIKYIQFAFLSLFIGTAIIHILAATLENYTKTIVAYDNLFKLALPWSIFGLSYMITSPLIGKLSQNNPRKVLLICNILTVVSVFVTKIEPKFLTLQARSCIKNPTGFWAILVGYKCKICKNRKKPSEF